MSGRVVISALAAKQRTNAIYQLAYRLKRFCHDIVRAYAARLGFVKRLERANQQHNRNATKPLALFDPLTEFITAAAGHKNIREHQVRRDSVNCFQSMFGIADCRDFHSFISEGEIDDFLNSQGVVGE